MEKIKNRVKGITLIALVVTIIVLLILAGVAISLTIGSNGIFTRAENAVDIWKEASENEEKELQNAEDFIDQYTNNKEDIKVSDVIGGDKFDTTTTIKDESGDDITIPGGFGIADDSGIDIDDGIVIEDEKENQFVWVPVENINNMIKTETVPLNKVQISTNKYSILRIIDSNKQNYGTVKPGDTSSVREPDVLSDYDTKSENINTILEKDGTIEDLAQEFVNEYTNMVKSIEKYNGFYIGRYELTGSLEDPREKSGQVLTSGNWYELYNSCKKIVNTNYAKTSMIYGCQWDEVCNWLKDEYNTDTDSSSWGNYNAVINTGTDSNYEAKKIYDLAGNYCEWTQEAHGDLSRVTRDPYTIDGSGQKVAASRFIVAPQSGFSLTTRATLYLKISD